MKTPTFVFYNVLGIYFQNSIPASSAVAEALAIYEKNRESFSLEDVSQKTLQEWHKQFHFPARGEDPGMAAMESIVVSAFQDLAGQIEHEEVRALIEKLKTLAGIPDDLFIRVNGLKDHGDGFAAVAVVTDNVAAFREFWQDPDEFIRMRGQVHYSETKSAQDPS